MRAAAKRRLDSDPSPQISRPSVGRPRSRPAVAWSLALGVLVMFAAAVAWPAAPVEASQVITPFTARFTANDTGNIVLTGNTVMTCRTSVTNCTAAQNGTATGGALNNNAYAMTYVDADGDATTFNSSRASLSLPTGATVLFAALYWGADTSDGATIGGVAGADAPDPAASNTVRFDTPAAGGYVTIGGTQIGISGTRYHSFSDVTSLIQAGGSGLYTVANVQAGTGGDRYGGWSLVVAYRAPGETPRNLTIFDGYAVVNNSGTTTISIPVSGFQTPPSGEVNTQLGVVAYEGDRGSTGDSFQLNSTNQSNAVNPATNFFNSTISSLGAPAGGGAPSFVNQLGFDIDLITVVPDLANGATSATIGLTTGGETYFPGVVTFATDLFAPEIEVTKAVTDLNGGTVDPGDTLEYTVIVTNTGGDGATGVVLRDPIPANATYAPGSLTVDAVARTDAAGDDQAEFAGNQAVFRLGTGANATTGGTLAVGATTTVTFRVTVNSAPAQQITNQATAEFTGATAGTPLSASSNPVTVTISPPSADLAITKTNGTTTVAPGQVITYTITVTNNGPSLVTGAPVTDTFNELINVSWTCSAPGGACGAASGTGNIDTTVDLGPNQSATFTVTATVDPNTNGDNMISNTATVALPPGFPPNGDPNPGNNTATDTDTVALIADLAVTKSSSPDPYVAGAQLTYTVVVTNNGPSPVTNATVTDTVPAALTNVTWTCSATAPNVCDTLTGMGNINATVDLVSGGSATFEITGTTPGSVITLTNTASVAAPSGVTDPIPGNNTATNQNPSGVITADLSVTKTSSASTVMPGQQLTYTVTASNAGPSSVTGAQVQDTLPAALTGATWTCTASAGSTCPASGSGNIDTTVDLASGGTATFIISGTVATSATGTVSNTATVTPPSGATDPDEDNNTGTSTVTVQAPSADLAITKTSTPDPYVAGQTLTYMVTVTNNGPSAVTGATVTDMLPAPLQSFMWQCTATAPNVCGAASGSGNINTTVNLANGGTATFTIMGTVPSGTSGALTNTATVTPPQGTTDPMPGNNSATNTNPTGGATADLSVTKTSTPNPYGPGQTLTYTVTVTNNGPSDVTGAAVADTVPAAITGVSWMCTPSGGSTCAAPSGSGNTIATTVNLPNGGSATFAITGTAPAGPVQTLTNTATVTTPTGTTDPDPSDNSSTDTNPAAATADLAVTKTSTPDPYVPGAPLMYTVVVTNNGPSDVTGATVTDTLPAALQSFMWQCAATSGSSCATASGTGNISTAVNLVSGGSATFTISGTVPASQTGGLTNTATVTPPQGTTDPTPSNNTATNENPSGGAQADLSVTKTSTPDPYVPGAPLTYAIVVTNNGPSNVSNASVTDTLPAALQSPTWTCTATAPNVCDATSGSGNINTTVDLVSGGTATFAVTGTVPSGTTGAITNTATVTPPTGVTDPTPSNNSATNTNPTGGATADLSITKSSAPDPYVPGQTLTYAIVVTNNGPSNVTGATVTDTLPAPFQSFTWTCSVTTGTGSSCGAASGSGNINTTVNLVSGGSANFTIMGTVPSGTTGAISNTVTVTPPPGATDPTPGNNSSTNQNPSGGARADLQITKSSNPRPVEPGHALTYTIVVTNAGPSDVVGAAVTDDVPDALDGATWTCTTAGGGVCRTASGSGDVNLLVDLPAGARATIMITGTVAAGATGSLTNTARVQPPAGVPDPDPSNNSATDTNPPAPPPPPGPGPTPTPTPTPAPPSGRPPAAGQPPPAVLPTPPPAEPITGPTGPTVAPGLGCVEGPSLSLHGEPRTEFVRGRTGTMFISPGQLGRDCRSTLDMALDLSIEPLTAGERGRATLTLTNVGATEYGGPLTTVVALPAGVRFSGDIEGDGWGCGEKGMIVLCTRQDPRDPARAGLPAIKPGDRTRVSLLLDVERGTPAAVTLWARLVTPGDAVPDNEVDRAQQSVAGASGPATEPAPAEPWRSLLDPAARLPTILLWLPRELPFRAVGEGWICDEVDNAMACVPRSVATPELPVLRVDTDVTAQTPRTVNVVSGISVPGAAGPSGTLTTFCIPLIDQTAAGGSPVACTVSSSP